MDFFFLTLLSFNLSGTLVCFSTCLSYNCAYNYGLCGFIFSCRLYAYEVEKSCDMNENLGAGIAVFQGLSNVALNCESDQREHTKKYYKACAIVMFLYYFFFRLTGIVLGTIFAGGTLISNNEMSAGDLMSFLVASQTVQR